MILSKIAQKSHQCFGLRLQANLMSRTFKNSPICSHWPRREKERIFGVREWANVCVCEREGEREREAERSWKALYSNTFGWTGFTLLLKPVWMSAWTGSLTLIWRRRHRRRHRRLQWTKQELQNYLIIRSERNKLLKKKALESSSCVVICVGITIREILILFSMSLKFDI